MLRSRQYIETDPLALHHLDASDTLKVKVWGYVSSLNLNIEDLGPVTEWLHHNERNQPKQLIGRPLGEDESPDSQCHEIKDTELGRLSTRGDTLISLLFMHIDSTFSSKHYFVPVTLYYNDRSPWPIHQEETDLFAAEIDQLRKEGVLPEEIPLRLYVQTAQKAIIYILAFDRNGILQEVFPSLMQLE